MTKPDKRLSQTDHWRPESGETRGLHDTSGSGEPAEAIPERVGRYRLETKLGQGGYGAVYLAYDEQLGRYVAVKLPRRRSDRPEGGDDHLAEARALASLDHPAIVPIHDIGETDDGRPYIVSKFVEGCDLTRYMAENRLSYTQSAQLVATVAEALHYAHKRHLVHRDVKPGNILMDAVGRPYVSDFGLALRNEDFGSGPTFSGTPLYMSPEQARGEGHLVDGRTDVYSLGVVLYELILGRRPFEAGTAEELVQRISNLDVRPPRQLDDAIPPGLERICLRALERRPADRYPTARDFAEDLRRFAASRDEGEPIDEVDHSMLVDDSVWRRRSRPPVLSDSTSRAPSAPETRSGSAPVPASGGLPLAVDFIRPAAPADMGAGIGPEKPPLASRDPLADGPAGFRCPQCRTTLAPITRSRISVPGWIVFGILLVFCFPLAIIGLFMRETFTVCAGCGRPLS